MGLKIELKQIEHDARVKFIEIAKEFASSKFEEINQEFIKLAKNCAESGGHDVEFEVTSPLHVQELSSKVLGKTTYWMGTINGYRLGLYRDELLSLLRQEHPDIDFRINIHEPRFIYANWA